MPSGLAILYSSTSLLLKLAFTATWYKCPPVDPATLVTISLFGVFFATWYKCPLVDPATLVTISLFGFIFAFSFKIAMENSVYKP